MNIAADIRLLALIIILLRAGLGISKDTLLQIGATALRMSFLPCLCEGATITWVAHKLLHLPLLEAGMLGFVLAAVSPAVVVPEMLKLQAEGWGQAKAIPEIILGGASVDDVFAITILSSLLSLTSAPSQVLWKRLLSIPWQILAGIGLGVALGYILCKLLPSQLLVGNKVNQSLMLMGFALAATWLGERWQVAGLLAVMTIGIVIREKIPPVADQLAHALGIVWAPAQIFLFTLLGAEVNVPLGLQAGAAGLLVILLGLLGRTLGVFLATASSGLNRHERLFCAIAYVPKATVQAAVGGLPLAAGVAAGEIILAIAALAIMVTAPLGALGIRYSAPRLLSVGVSRAPALQFSDD